MYYPIERLLSSLTDLIITINIEDYQRIVKNGFKSNSIKLVNGVGINLNEFKPIKSNYKTKLRDQYGFKQNDLILIYVAELNKNKNQKLLLQTLYLLKEKYPQVKLLLVGSGELESYYLALINKLSLNNNVEMLGRRNDISELLNISDIYVSSSLREGLPVNILEAMACGLPIIATNCRGNRDLVTNGENGILVEANNYYEFSKVIENLLDNSHDKYKFAKNSLLKICDYDLEKIFLEMKLIYKQI